MKLGRVRIVTVAAILVGASALFSSVPLYAQQSTDELRVLAGRGNADAQYNLGVRYLNGKDVAQDDIEAIRWFRFAADQRHAFAQYNLGVLYERGQGVPQNYVEAAQWYRLAAVQGDLDAHDALGLMYMNGLGVNRDHVEAVRLFRLPASRRIGTAQANLGIMYANGWGIPRDNVVALMWLRLAGGQSNVVDRDRIVATGDAVAAGMTAEQVAEAQRRVRDWTPKPAP